MAVNNMWHL